MLDEQLGLSGRRSCVVFSLRTQGLVDGCRSLPEWLDASYRRVDELLLDLLLTTLEWESGPLVRDRFGDSTTQTPCHVRDRSDREGG